MYVKTPNNHNNQDIAHHAPQEWTIFIVKWSKQKHSKVTGQKKPTFQIFHNLTCKSQNLIYLLHCRICQLQYVGKSETPFSICLNNHRKDSESQASILACKHFNHNFQQHAEFTRNKNTFKTKRRFLGFKTKNFISRWVKSRVKQHWVIRNFKFCSSTVHICPTTHYQQTGMISKT